MTVVVGYIPTAEGRAALDYAEAEARLRGSRLVIVNLRRDDALSDVRSASDDLMVELQEKASASGAEVAVVSAHATHTSQALIDIATDESSELIVIGLRRRSAVGKFVMGSTAMEILMNAPCPVLSVTPSVVA